MEPTARELCADSGYEYLRRLSHGKLHSIQRDASLERGPAKHARLCRVVHRRRRRRMCEHRDRVRADKLPVPSAEPGSRIGLHHTPNWREVRLVQRCEALFGSQCVFAATVSYQYTRPRRPQAPQVTLRPVRSLTARRMRPCRAAILVQRSRRTRAFPSLTF